MNCELLVNKEGMPHCKCCDVYFDIILKEKQYPLYRQPIVLDCQTIQLSQIVNARKPYELLFIEGSKVLPNGFLYEFKSRRFKYDFEIENVRIENPDTEFQDFIKEKLKKQNNHVVLKKDVVFDLLVSTQVCKIQLLDCIASDMSDNCCVITCDFHKNFYPEEFFM